MGQLFHMDSPIMRFLGGMTDLIALNLIWLICCIPLITIGPSTAAMYCVARRITRKEYPSVLQAFFREFRANFRTSLLVSLALLLPAALAGAYLLAAVSGGLDGLPLVKYLSCLAAAVIASACSYAYPLLALFDNSVGSTLKNALILPLANPFLAAAVTGLNILPVLLLLLNEPMFVRCSFFWLVIGGSLTALVNIRVLDRFFQKFVPSE